LQEQASADAGFKSAQANLTAFRQDLARLKAERLAVVQQRQNVRLLAMQDSTVMSRDAEPGSTVVAGQAVLKLVDTRSLWIKARFDQGRSSRLALGLAASIVLRANAGKTLPGQVARVELQADSVTEERIAQITLTSLPVCQFASWACRWLVGRSFFAVGTHSTRTTLAQCCDQAPSLS
jgi:HlyD family secretion protein